MLRSRSRLRTGNVAERVEARLFVSAYSNPSVGMTYANTPNDVYRFSFGKYSQPSAAAFAQYNRKEQDLPDSSDPSSIKYGYDQPGHVVPPDITYNFDAVLGASELPAAT